MTLLEKIKSKTWYKSITTQQEILLELASNLGSGGIGSKGEKGDQGIQGVAGTKGDQGIQGIQGISGTSGSNASSIAFNISPTFKSFPLVVAQKLITAPLTITPNTTGAIAGASVLMRFVADGNIANTPIFLGAEQVSGSSGWDNRAGIVNLVQMQFDGVDFFYSIVQKALGAVLDLQAPVLVSSEINITPFGTKAILTFNENLLSTSLPTQSDFNNFNILNTTINGKILTLFFSKAFEAGITLVLQYSGNSIKDLAGNLANSFTTSIVIPNVNAIIPANLDSRQSGIDQVSVGTYKKNLAGWRVAMSSSLNFVATKLLRPQMQV